MPMLRITLFNEEFQVLDTVDVPVAKDTGVGAGAASKAAKEHYWTNHFETDLNPLLATRQNALERLQECIETVERLQECIQIANAHLRTMPHVTVRVPEITVPLAAAKAALMEGNMIGETALPEKYRTKLRKHLKGPR